jgi:hypothetical protein
MVDRGFDRQRALSNKVKEFQVLERLIPDGALNEESGAWTTMRTGVDRCGVQYIGT